MYWFIIILFVDAITISRLKNNYSPAKANIWYKYHRKKKSLGTRETAAEPSQPVEPNLPAELDLNHHSTVERQPNSKSGGRNGFADYSGLPTTIISHEITPGSPCPDCQEHGDSGKLYNHEPGVVVSLTGQPIISGNKYQILKLRCNLCSKVFIPKAAQEVLELPKYSPSCGAVIAMHKYNLGSAFYRIEKYQEMLGIPLPSSTQWDLSNALGLNSIPIFKLLECYAAEAEAFKFDDSPHKIMDLPNPKQRSNSFTTAIIGEHLGRQIVLYYTNAEVAGEVMYDLLSSRKSDANFLSMSDAANSNFSNQLPAAILAKMVICFCLVHGRRNFFKIFKFFDKECLLVLDCISKVYAAEKHCKLHGLDANARLLYHQQHSGPVMDSLRIWLNNKLLYKDVEPNNALGQAIKYLLKNWDYLTRFLTVAGAAIDNNSSEQVIKLSILHRKNSLYYRSSHGARIGSILMSLIKTAIANQVNPLDYLTAINTFPDRVRAGPELWLPWNYQEQLSTSIANAA